MIPEIGHFALWLALGEAASKCEHISKVPLRPATAQALRLAKTAKTMQRDLNGLVEMGLIVRDGRKVRARREVILAFLPLRKQPDAPANS